MLFAFMQPEKLNINSFLDCMHQRVSNLMMALISFNRFDVAGIHPKSKTPGTITQVFYDKKSMGNLVSLHLTIKISVSVSYLKQSSYQIIYHGL